VPVREGPTATTVSDVMTTMPVTVGPDDDLAEAVRLMTDLIVKSLPVVERGHVVGMVSRADVVRQLARRDERVRSEVDDLVQREDLDWMVDVTDGVVTFDGPSDERERRLGRTLAGSVAGVVAVRFAQPT
jgi:CBS domain-containing protein